MGFVPYLTNLNPDQVNVPPARSRAPLIIGQIHIAQPGFAVLVVIQLPQLFGELLLIVNQGILMKVWPELLETSNYEWLACLLLFSVKP